MYICTYVRTYVRNTEVGEQAPHGCIDEMITPGGEMAFVTAMIKDSLQLKDRVSQSFPALSLSLCLSVSQSTINQIRILTPSLPCHD